MSRRWFLARKNDKYYRRAKREGYRSRAAYKIGQIERRYHVFRPGGRVVDLGAAPGGWSQVARQMVGHRGTVIAVDLDRIPTLPGVVRIRGDATEPATLDRIRQELKGRRADLLISDMSPSLSGIYSVDEAKSHELAAMAVRTAERLLRSGGKMVVKVFAGPHLQGLIRWVRPQFARATTYRPKATRIRSSEVYLIGIGYRLQRSATDSEE